MKSIVYYSSLFLAVLGIISCQSNKEISLQKGMTINRSVTIKQDTFYLNGADSIAQPVIRIEGENIVVDFNGAVLIGSTNYDQPHTFEGLGIEVKNGKNITIKNLVVKGYKVGLIATGIDSLKILDTDFSYNYRQALKSTWEKEDLSDWMSYHHNEEDQWLRYGMAIYLRHCNYAIVKNLKVTGGQNGLMMTHCNNGLFYNNDISFNSGIGIGMYRSSHNKVMHNLLDWNIRGYSFGRYNRRQDSAGILLYEQCKENIIAFNSATHSGDGFFLWAGQSTIDSGEGGCNDNVVYDNDFSYASNNGIEVTFSGGNKFYKNKLYDCDYGLWGAYSYDTEIIGNSFKNNHYSIAIEHGNNNLINNNQFVKDEIGIKLFERQQQPREWYFANNRDVQSRDYEINENIFSEMEHPFDLNKTKGLTIEQNLFYKTTIPSFVNKKINKTTDAKISDKDSALPSTYSSTPNYLEDGINPFLKERVLKGRPYIILDQYGPYNFKYPALFLRKVEGNIYTFAIFGPFGNWKAIGGEGFKMMSQKRGSLPATLVLEAEENATALLIELEYLGHAFVDAFGVYHKKGKPIKLIWRKGN